MLSIIKYKWLMFFPTFVSCRNHTVISTRTRVPLHSLLTTSCYPQRQRTSSSSIYHCKYLCPQLQTLAYLLCTTINIPNWMDWQTVCVWSQSILTSLDWPWIEIAVFKCPIQKCGLGCGFINGCGSVFGQITGLPC